MIRVAMVSELYHPYSFGGGERRYWEISRRLSKMGLEVSVYTTGYDYAQPYETIDGVRIFRISRLSMRKPPSRSINSSLEYFVKILPSLYKGDYDIVDVNTYIPVAPSFLASKVKGIPIIATIHDVYLKDWFNSYPDIIGSILGYFTEWYTCRLPFSGVIVPSRGVKEKLRVPRSTPIRIIPNGVDLQIIDSVKYNKKEGQIIYVGRLAPHKRVEDLIYAVSLLREDVKLVVVGDGILKEKLQKLSVSLGVDAAWTGFLKRYEEVIRLIKESSVLVLPSLHEGQGIVLLEAMACRTPFITAVNYGTLSILSRGVGIGVPPSNPKALAEAIRSVLDGKLSYSLEKARRIVETEYTWEKVSEMVLNFYKHVLSLHSTA